MIDTVHLDFFHTILSSNQVIHTPSEILDYASDETENFVFPADLVLIPENELEVSKILSYCNEHKIFVTALGALTGLSGGALCVQGGIGLSTERMNKILDIDENNGQVTVEPGVITQILQEECAKKGWYYAPDPASRGSCSIGGNLAENSGGPHAVKYGVTKDFVLNLEVVLANGDIIWTGANTLKNSTGFNLTQLMVGSEGTLGIITKAVLKLVPLPPHNKLLLAPFPSAEKACAAVSAIFKSGITPSALEFMERDAILLTLQFVEGVQMNLDGVEAHLLIEVDGSDESALMLDCEKILAVLEQFEVGEVLFAEDHEQKEKLWQLRRKVGEAVKSHSIYKEEDTVVPRYALPKLLSGVKVVGKKYGFKSVCYGHAGDGNLHVNILKGDLTDEQWSEELPKAITELFKLVVELKGTLSGEHGIGYVQKEYMPIVFNEKQLNLMKQIKQVFDPNGILNPGKIFPS